MIDFASFSSSLAAISTTPHVPASRGVPPQVLAVRALHCFDEEAGTEAPAAQ